MLGHTHPHILALIIGNLWPGFPMQWVKTNLSMGKIFSLKTSNLEGKSIFVCICIISASQLKLFCFLFQGLLGDSYSIKLFLRTLSYMGHLLDKCVSFAFPVRGGAITFVPKLCKMVAWDGNHQAHCDTS